MAFRFRKSINLGGFRINLSKSGIGYSFGAKGLRFTRKANGGARATVSIPHTGVSYVKDFSTHSKVQVPAAKEEKIPAPAEEVAEDELIESTPNEMIDRLNRADKLYSVFKTCRIALPIIGVLLLCVVVAIVSNGMKLTFDTGEAIDGTVLVVICAVLSAISLGASIYVSLQNVKIELAYDFSEDERFGREYSDFTKALSDFQTAEQIWESRDGLPRDRAGISFTPLEAYIHTDLNIQTVMLFHKKLLFLPDIIAVKQENGWAGVPYTEAESTFYEEQKEETTVSVLIRSFQKSLAANLHFRERKRQKKRFITRTRQIGI